LFPEQLDKVVVITGISKGLGRSLAIEFAKRGITVVGCARNEEQLSVLEKVLRDGGSSKHLLKKVDVVCSLALSLVACSVYS
jgi:short-subunit dehydrogenase